MAVHPRVRGEHVLPKAVAPTITGSSPRARGTHRVHHELEVMARFIPACAGNTPTPPSRRHRPGGSSPRARGTLPGARSPGVRRRFIPACAGNTPMWAATKPTSSVHPRVRGEHPTARHDRNPPRRFIPACAGNTGHGHRRQHEVPVHPRVRGEHGTIVGHSAELYGSSPRARGTPRSQPAGCPVFRFIPACAGNTETASPPPRWRTVHPRVRGEHIRSLRFSCFLPGSSPRARGTLLFVNDPVRPRRFIPACAGNTRQHAPGGHAIPVHPRVRGEHPLNSTRHRTRLGSSPRARGTRRQVARRRSAHRFIPACAGNTESPASPVASIPGSSPRARGTLRRFVARLHVSRFIPACAGNTRTWCGCTAP